MPGNGVFSCATFCLRLLGRLERFLDLPNLERDYIILIHVTSYFVPFLSFNLHSMRELGSQSHFFEDKIMQVYE